MVGHPRRASQGDRAEIDRLSREVALNGGRDGYRAWLLTRLWTRAFGVQQFRRRLERTRPRRFESVLTLALRYHCRARRAIVPLPGQLPWRHDCGLILGAISDGDNNAHQRRPGRRGKGTLP